MPSPRSPSSAALHADALRDIAVAGGLLLVLSLALAAAARFGPYYAVKALALFGLAGWAVMRGLAGHAPHARFGPANRVTLARLANVALLAAAIGEPRALAPGVAWGIVAVATLGAVVDAVDGPLARASGLASAFGARFDMETDALLTLVLCLLVVQAGQVGPWVLAAGAMRYVFVAAARCLPWLAAPLPERGWRKAVCVLQITSLIVCLGPIVSRPLAGAIALASLAALSASFGADVVWLARRRRIGAAV